MSDPFSVDELRLLERACKAMAEDEREHMVNLLGKKARSKVGVTEGLYRGLAYRLGRMVDDKLGANVTLPGMPEA